jgi:hypothetical protein
MKTEVILSSLFIVWILIGTIRINFFNKNNEGLLTGLVSLASVVFGLFLILTDGIQFDYELNYNEIHQDISSVNLLFGKANVIIGLLFIIQSLIKYILWRIRRN